MRKTYVIAGFVGLMGVAVAGRTGGPAVSVPSAGAAADAPRASKLFKDSRLSIAIARAQGRKTITLLVATVPGGVAAVEQRVTELGGDVRYREAEIGYLRVRVPVDRASELADSDRIDAITADYDDSYPSRLMPGDAQLQARAAASGAKTTTEVAPQSPAAGARSTPAPATARPSAARQTPARADAVWPPVWGAYPLEHPYSPLADIDAAVMRRQHPTYDGRGVTIALLDGNVDLLLPEFQTAYTLDGKAVPKIADYLNVTDPRDDADLVPQWVNMAEQVTASGRQVTFGGKTFTTPRDGAFRIGLFSERRFNDPANAAYIDQDVDRNGNPKGDDGLFGVLWDEQTNDVWVDTNRDLSFADQKPMTDYIRRQDVGVFGKDDPKTPVRESIGFTVQTDRANKFVSINLGIYQHATTIMGAVIGNKEPKGRLQGIAPGARLVSMFWGVGVAHSMIEGLIAAFKHPEVDLIVLEQHVGVASMPYLLADAHHPISIVAQRLIDKYHKLMFVPGGNAPGSAIVAEDGLAPGAMSVGGYQSQESYRLNAGFVPESVDNLHWGALSHGPSGAGQLKPDILAPSGQMGTGIGIRAGASIKGLFQLPPGYEIDGGTSTATPMACGAAALVVSAAKQTRVPFDAPRLKAALTGSARYIARFPANEQGSGLVQVAAAYDLLKKLPDAPVTIVSRAPVRTRLSGLLQTPGEGVGLYEREGWTIGGRGTRTITFTRTSGPAEPMTFTLTWQGNDGTFSSAASIALPLNTPVELPVAIAVKTMGMHAATLTLDHPSVPGHAYRLLNTVVAPLTFTRENGFKATGDVTVSRPGDRGLFVLVPPGTPALNLSLAAEDGKVRLYAITPGREEIAPCSYLPAAKVSCAVERPEPGVWEINASMNDMAREFDPDRARPLKPATAKLTATLAGVTIETAGGAPAIAPTAASAGAGSTNLTLSLKNRFAPVSASAVSVALGSASQARRTIARGEQQQFEVLVPKGASSLRAWIGDVADEGADLDLYLLDCTAPEKAEKKDAEKPKEKEKGNKSPEMTPPACAPKAKAATVDRDGSVEVADPAPGRWLIVVDAYAVPGGKTTYAYGDLFTHPKFGTIAVADVPEAREPDGSWTAAAHAWIASRPEAPRTLVGRVIAASPDVKPAKGDPVPLGALDLPLGTPPPATTSAGGR